MTHSHSKLVAGFVYGLMFLFLSTGIAQAQIVTAITVHGEDGWVLNAAVANGHVVGFLATHDPSTIPTGSYASVWFERQSDDSFTAAGNVADTPTAVAKRIELDKSAVLFEQAELNDPSDPVAATLNSFYFGPFQVTLDPLNKGLAEDDPFQSIIDELSPDEMELVVELGGHGAVSLSALAIAVNNCQPDTGTGTSAHGVALLEARLASDADYIDQLLVMSVDDWNDPESIGAAMAGITWRDFCGCYDHDFDFDVKRIECSDPGYGVGQHALDCMQHCKVFVDTWTAHEYDNCTSSPGHETYRATTHTKTYDVVLPDTACGGPR